MKIGCVVMAAGKGRRFGGNKLLAPLAGKPVLRHVLDALPREELARVTAVAGSPEVMELCRVSGITARRNESGLLSESVRLGIETMEGMDGCLFVMGDQPLCTAATLLRMIAAFQGGPLCIYRLCCQGLAGSPVLFPRSLFPRLMALAGEQGGMEAVQGQNIPICLMEADGDFELWDIDTGQDLQRAEVFLLRNR